MPDDELVGFIQDYVSNPRYEGEILSPQTEKELFFNGLRWICKNDLYKFDKYILGYSEMYEPLHRPLCDWYVENRKLGKNTLLIIPRGHFKSTIFTIGASIQESLIDPEIRILIANIIHNKAKDFLHELRGKLESRVILRLLFPEIIPSDPRYAEKWTNEQLTVLRKEPRASPTFDTAGLDSKVVGSHYDKLKLDDIIDETTVRTKEGIHNTLEWFRRAQPLLDPPGKIDVIGTRKHFDDFYNTIITEYVPTKDYAFMERRVLEGPNVKKFVDYVIRDDKDADIIPIDKEAIWKDKPIFPTIWPKATIKKYRQYMGEQHFWNEMMNFPIDPDQQVFKREFARTWKHIPTGCYRYITMDPSVGATEDSDFTAIIDNYVDWEKKWYLRAYRYERIGEKKIIDALLEMYAETPDVPRAIGIETEGWQRNLKDAFKEECEKRRITIPIVELKTHGRAKDGRIRSLQYFYEKGHILFAKEMKGIMEDEVFRYPRGRNDDFLDALAYQGDIIREYGYPDVPDVIQLSWQRAWAKRHQEEELATLYGESKDISVLMRG